MKKALTAFLLVGAFFIGGHSAYADTYIPIAPVQINPYSWDLTGVNPPAPTDTVTFYMHNSAYPDTGHVQYTLSDPFSLFSD